MKKIFLASALLIAAGAMTAVAQTHNTSVKSNNDVNPIIPFNLCADPTAVEYEGRLYIYGSNDQLELETTGDRTHNTYGKITQLVCMSTADLVNWTMHEPIDVKFLSPWIATSWAPSIVSRMEDDGKTHFYLYYTNTASGIGVLTATSPTGPWTDPLGKALINGSTPGRGEQSNIIDPGVCIDDNGDAWLTFGGGDPNAHGTTLMPGNARIVKLGKNMISLDGEIKPIPAPFHFEANELNYINGKYVFSYSGGWSCNASVWSGYEGKNGYSCPGNCSILYMVADDPMNGPWTYKGEMLKNPGTFGYPWGNNHSHLQKFGDNYYMTYHTQYLESKLGLSGGYRCISINKATVSESSVYVTATMNNAGPSMLADKTPIAHNVCEAEEMANSAGIVMEQQKGKNMLVTGVDDGDWTYVRNVRFLEEAKSVTLRIRGKGKVKIYSSRIGGTPLCEASFEAKSLTNLTFDLNNAVDAGKTLSLFFLFSDTETTKPVKFDTYQFNKYTVEELTGVESVEMDNPRNGKVMKSLDNGKVVIEKNGNKYNPAGQLLK